MSYILKSARIYLTRYFFLYLMLSLTMAVVTVSFFFLTRDTLRQQQVIHFYQNTPYDLITPKGNSLESLLFIENISAHELNGYIPTHLYETLRQNPALTLIPLIKLEQNGNTVTVGTDPTLPNLSTTLDFLRRHRAQIQLVGTEQNRLHDPVWGNNILNLILVSGPLLARQELREVVQKRTVAEYISISERADQLSKLMGWTTQNRLIQWGSLTGLTLAMTSAGILAVRPLWLEINLVLRRWNRSQSAVIPLLLPLAALYTAATLLLFGLIP